MPFHSKLLLGKLRNPVSRKAHPISDVSARCWEVHPAETQTVPPAIYLHGDMDRAKKTSKWWTLRDQREMLTRSRNEHLATVADEVKDVWLVQNHLYKDAWRRKLGGGFLPVFLRDPVEKLQHASLASAYAGNTNFGHWLTDDVHLHLLAGEVGSPVSPPRPLYKHESAYSELFGIAHRTVSHAKIDSLIIFRDVGYNSHKAARTRELRARLKLHFPSRGAERIFVRRGSTGNKRLLVNEAEVEAFLATLGFIAVTPEELTPHELVRRTIAASVVVSVEGSQMLHSLYSLREGGALCVLQPPFRVQHYVRGQLDALGMRYATLTGLSEGRGFRIDTNELGRVLDMVDAEIATPSKF